ncbi:MAG: YdcH family protein [Betaproteobacteria bacterium]|nr:YdcH family protein [Betaproteobacteria bacterium]
MTGDVLELDPTGEDARRVALVERIVRLRIEHRDLNDVIDRLGDRADVDDLQVTRMKRRKLLIKDQIAWLERELDPDIPA